MKKIIKLGLILLIISFSINTVSCEWLNGSVEKNIQTDNNHGMQANDGFRFPYTCNPSFYYESKAVTGIVDIIKYTRVQISYEGAFNWADIPNTVGGNFYITNTNPITYGSIYFLKKETNVVDIWLDFDYPTTQNFTDDTTYTLVTNWNTIDFYYKDISCVSNHNSEIPLGFKFIVSGGAIAYHNFGVGTVTITQLGSFKNDYSIWKDGYILDLDVNKYFPDHTYTNSQVVIKNDNDNIIYESGFSTTNVSISPGNYTNTYYVELNVDNSLHIILDNVGDGVGLPTEPNLITDKEIYNYMDEITFNYSNLNNIEDGAESYDLIAYCIDNQGNYKSLSGLHLNYGYDKYDGQAWFSTTGYPYGDIYYGVIDNSLDYENNKNVIMSNVYLSDTIFIIPQLGNPYISITDKQDYYNNGNTLYYSYYTTVESNITIEDYNNEVITKILYVNGTGIGKYTLPYDDNKNYEYSVWSINMSSYNDTYTVYWIEQDVIPYNPDYTPDVDPEIQANIDDIKDELEPIKDLIFGLSTIFLDNPDYDSNGIVDTEELSNWFNSIVMVIIVLTIYIFYRGLRRK